jgi:hypothetical protein
MEKIAESAPRQRGVAPAKFDVVREGRRYRSTALECVASYGRHNPRDAKRVQEDLFRSSKGAFLLVCSGGPLSPWRYDIGDGWTDGHAFAALTADEARRWLEHRGQDDELLALFGDEIDDA